MKTKTTKECEVIQGSPNNNTVLILMDDGGVVAVSLTQHECRPTGYPGLESLVEDLMEEHDGLTNKTNKQNGSHERLPLFLSLSPVHKCWLLPLCRVTPLSQPVSSLTTSHLLRKMLLTSSCVMGGFLELAAMRRGRRKLLTRMWSCWTYSASASSMLNTTWFLFRMLSA